MKNMCRIIALILTACMLFSFTACSNTGDEYSTWSEVVWVDDDTATGDSDTDNTDATDSSNSSDSGKNNNSSKGNGKDNNSNNNTSGENKNPEGSGGSENVTPPSKEEIKDLRGTTVDVLWWQEPTDDEKTLFKNFENKYGIKVNVIQTTDEQYNTKISSMIVAKEGLDVANVQNFPFTTTKCFQPVSVMGIDASDKFWNQEVTKSYSIGGKAYGVAADNNLWISTFRLLYFDEDIFVANGVTTPRELWEAGNWNWDTFYDISVQLHEADPEMGILYATGTPFMDVQGVDFVSYDGKEYKNNTSNPKVLKAWQMSAKFLDAGVYSNVTIGEDISFAKGNLAMMYSNSWRTRKDSFGNEPDSVDCVPFPAPKGEEIRICSETRAFGCPKGSDNPLAAGLFVKYFLDNDNYPTKVENVVRNPNMAKTLKWALDNTDKNFIYGPLNIMGYTIKTKNRSAITYELTRTSASQITTVINQYASSIDGSVKEANKIINK